MNVPANVAKSSVLASVIFWGIILSSEFDLDITPFVLLSYIPIFLCVLIIIVGSICPFFWSAKGDIYTKTQVFKMCFPYYTVVVLGCAVLGFTRQTTTSILLLFSFLLISPRANLGFGSQKKTQNEGI